jgi:hypothetical protein
VRRISGCLVNEDLYLTVHLSSDNCIYLSNTCYNCWAAVHKQNYNIKTLSLSVSKPPESSIKPQESKKEIISLESLHVKCALSVEISSDDF